MRRFKKKLSGKWHAKRNHDFTYCNEGDCRARIVFSQSSGIGTCQGCGATYAHSKDRAISSYR